MAPFAPECWPPLLRNYWPRLSGIVTLPQEIVFPPTFVYANGTNTDSKSESILKNAMWDIERQLIIKTILDAGYNKSKAARMLKVDRKTLYNKIKLYQIDI